MNPADPVQKADPMMTLVLRSVAQGGGDATVQSIARASGASTVVVIPALVALTERELISRSVSHEVPTSRATWRYRITAKGRREMQLAG